MRKADALGLALMFVLLAVARQRQRAARTASISRTATPNRSTTKRGRPTSFRHYPQSGGRVDLPRMAGPTVDDLSSLS